MRIQAALEAKANSDAEVAAKCLARAKAAAVSMAEAAAEVEAERVSVDRKVTANAVSVLTAAIASECKRWRIL